MKKKRIICAVTALALMLGLPGCGAGNVSAALDIVSGAVDDMRELEPTAAPAATAAPTPEPTPDPTPEPTPEPTPTPPPMQNPWMKLTTGLP